MKKFCLQITLLGALLAYTACEDGKNEYLSDFSSIIYFRNSGEIPLTIYDTGEKTDYNLIVNKAGSNLGAVASCGVKVMNESDLMRYNEVEGLNYKALPRVCYDFEDCEMHFTSDELYKSLKVSLDANLINQSIGSDATYVIPFELYDLADSINSDKQFAFIVPRVEEIEIGFENSGLITFDEIIGKEGTITVTQTVIMSVPNQWELTCVVEPDITVLEQYNATNHRALPMVADGSYAIEVAPFEEGSNLATITITLDKSKLAWGLQALPLRITGNSSGFPVSETSSTCIMELNCTVSRDELIQIPLSLDMLSSNATVVGDGTGLAGLFDGRGSGLHWHSNYSGTVLDAVYGHYIDFELEQPINHFAYNFWTRFENAAGSPKTTVIYASENGVKWKEIGRVYNNFTRGDEEYDSNVFSADSAFKYVRFSVIENPAGSVCTGQFWNCGEMEIFGK